MSQDQRGRDQVPVAALPPVFAHVDIAEHYQEGRFSSRLEAEIADILWNGQPVEEPEGGRPIALTDEALSVLHDLNCIALIQAGQVLPLLDREDISTPRTAIERAQLYHSAARTLLDIVACLTTNPRSAGAAYGYPGMGPYRGAQTELVRIPFADANCLRLPVKNSMNVSMAILKSFLTRRDERKRFISY